MPLGGQSSHIFVYDQQKSFQLFIHNDLNLDIFDEATRAFGGWSRCIDGLSVLGIKSGGYVLIRHLELTLIGREDNSFFSLEAGARYFVFKFVGMRRELDGNYMNQRYLFTIFPGAPRSVGRGALAATG